MRVSAGCAGWTSPGQQFPTLHAGRRAPATTTTTATAHRDRATLLGVPKWDAHDRAEVARRARRRYARTVIRRGFLVLLVACGSTADLSLVTKDGGTAPPPLAPTLDFRDRDLRKGSMSGPLVVHPIAEESTDTAYEVMLEGSDAPLATLAANAGKDL